MKKNIAILGYGSQGRAWALNLIDSGCKFTVGIPSGDKSRQTARKDGIADITTVRKATAKSDIVIFAFPDHLHGQVYKDDIAPNLKEGSCLVFLHGYSIHFRTVVPPPDCDIVLLAPLGPGIAVREKYLQESSPGFFFCIHRDTVGGAKEILSYLTKAMKIDSKALIKTTIAEEAVGDIFGEQAVLCGGLTQLIKNGFETLIENGLSPDKAYLEVAYQLDLIVELIRNYGIEGMYKRISVAARYGSFIDGPRIIGSETKQRMKRLLSEIKSGRFADRLNNLTPDDLKKLDAELKSMSHPGLEKAVKKFSPKKKR
jgi:ketol-acid reductoisomerase